MDATVTEGKEHDPQILVKKSTKHIFFKIIIIITAKLFIKASHLGVPIDPIGHFGLVKDARI